MNSQSTNTYLPPLLREALVRDGKSYKLGDLKFVFFPEMEQKYKENFAVTSDKGKPREYYAMKFLHAGGGAPPTNTISKMGEVMSAHL